MGKRNIISDNLQSKDDEPINKKKKFVVGSKGNKASNMLNKHSSSFTANTSYQSHSKFIEPASSSSESDSDDEGEEDSDTKENSDADTSDDKSSKVDNKVIDKNNSRRKHIGPGSGKTNSANESDNDHDSDDSDDSDDDDDEEEEDSSEEEGRISVEKGHKRKNVEMGGNRKNISSNISDEDDESNNSSEDDEEDISENDDKEVPQKKTADVDEEDELAILKKELANIPLQDLIKVKEKIGLKVFNKLMHGETLEKKGRKEFKRENKNRPMEISSKRRVPILRQTGVTKEMVRRDPRFDDLSGEYKEEHFLKDYSFINDIKDKERQLIQAKMKKTKDENKRHEMGRLLSKMKQQQQSDNAKQKKMELEKLWKEKEKQLIKDGKNPYFLKKSEKKKLELAEKYKELKESGKIEKYLSKKLKKNAQKERKKLPRQRQQFS